MKKTLFLVVILFTLSSHDMFLKPDGYYLKPNTQATIALFNGTFDNSENVIDRDRMIDVSLVGNGQRTRVDTTQWTEDETTTYLNFTTGGRRNMGRRIVYVCSPISKWKVRPLITISIMMECMTCSNGARK